MRLCRVDGDDRTRYLLHPSCANHCSAINPRCNHTRAFACANIPYANDHPNKRRYSTTPGLRAFANVQPM